MSKASGTIFSSAGFLWATGWNKTGELGGGYGYGDASAFNYFQQSLFENVEQATGGPGRTIFLKKDKSLWGLGNNHSGNLGLGYELLPGEGEIVDPIIAAATEIKGNVPIYQAESWFWEIARLSSELKEPTEAKPETKFKTKEVPIFTSKQKLPLVIRVDEEKMMLTAVSGSEVTVTRGIEGSAAVSHKKGARLVDPAEIESRPDGPTGPAVSNVVAIGSRGGPCYAQLSDGHVLAWGGNTSGQLGNGYQGTNHFEALIERYAEEAGEFRPQLAPWWVQTGGPPQGPSAPRLTGVRQLLPVPDGCYFLMAGDEVRYIGAPNTGEGMYLYAKIDPRIQRYVEAGGLKGAHIEAIAGAKSNLILLLTDKTIRVAGANNYGQRGEGVTGKTKGAGHEGEAGHEIGGKEATGVAEPINLPPVKAIAAGEDLCVALSVSGHVFTWGHNHHGQLGNGQIQRDEILNEEIEIENATPFEIPGLSNVVAIMGAGEPEAGTSTIIGMPYCVALLNDKSVRAWGGNNEGQLGDLTYLDKTEPVEPYGNMKDIGLIACQSTHFIAIRNQGEKVIPSITATRHEELGAQRIFVKWKHIEPPEGTGFPAQRKEEGWTVRWRVAGTKETWNTSGPLPEGATSFDCILPAPLASKSWEVEINGKSIKNKGVVTSKTVPAPKELLIKWTATTTEPNWVGEWLREETWVVNTGQLHLAKLSSPLSTAAKITSLPVAPLEFAIAKAAEIALDDGAGHKQVWNVSAAAKGGDTHITVTSQKPTFAFPTGTNIEGPVKSEVFWHQTAFPGNVEEGVMKLVKFKPGSGQQPTIPTTLTGEDPNTIQVRVEGTFLGAFQIRTVFVP